MAEEMGSQQYDEVYIREKGERDEFVCRGFGDDQESGKAGLDAA
jgi:hypothetical protein